MAHWQTLDNLFKHISKSLWSSANGFRKSLALPRRALAGQSAQNAKKSLAIYWQNLDHLPRILTNYWPTLLRNSRQSARSTHSTSLPLKCGVEKQRTTSSKGAKHWVLVKFSAFNSCFPWKRKTLIDLIMAFYECYVDFESKKLTSAYSFPPFREVVLLSLKSTGEGNEVAMDKFLAICREILDHLPRNPGPSAENANKSSAICQDCQGPSAENANKFSAICQNCQGPSAENANKSSAICRDCQGLPLKHACQECQVFLGWPWLPAHSAA